jgi:hypothetical protein
VERAQCTEEASNEDEGEEEGEEEEGGKQTTRTRRNILLPMKNRQEITYIKKKLIKIKIKNKN